ncbi:type I-E CRISPR-associated protein Cas7/Cse4/CasC [Lactobacillus sp. ESL0677]|uniref:type I-E CRISPR-associated protein Cas7/Cse4/CasC n=1 Tax=Lactobacillus sp. ESL0677 TaxID=2983208 RepID=UPI0023F8DF96|nr:type I-E CRISPR-associated protein Cas7/Cse4/CasC [Lactobacillus sp. ESL0677]WEV36923.1 type I-E CRISPR-associated protein Cas7/Cse4/CasC [Lactobacillus sp. ESL0677]
MTNKNLYLDLNVLQTVPSSNINRDDTGAPKTALYGGVKRARVSSQSWKKAMRDYFRDENIESGIRTKKVADLFEKKLKELDNSLDDVSAVNKAKKFLFAVINPSKYTKEIKKKNPNFELPDALLFISPGQIDKLADYALNHDKLDDKNVKKEIKQILKKDNSLDLALFGRMVATNPELNVDASAQVAHAISTHEIVPEHDYFTALDDLQSDDANGAAMLGTIEYDSATLYRYANINVKDLAKNLGNRDAIQSIIAFIKAFTLSMPTGKQNTFANKTLPNYIMVTLRPDTPVNLVSAFEEPVVTKGGFVKSSIQKLEDEYQSTNIMLEDPLLNVVLSRDGSGQLEKVTKLSDLLDRVSAALTKVMQDEDTND